jgi:dCMP deaminase
MIFFENIDESLESEHSWVKQPNGLISCIDCGQSISNTLNPCRSSWPDTWMSIAKLLAEKRSYDPRLKVCALVVPDDNTGILSLGYNGSAKGELNAPASTLPGQSEFIHAELNCIIKLDYSHHKPKHMYVTHSPCKQCAKIIVNAGIVRVIYGEEYRDVSGLNILKSSGIEVLSIDEAIIKARNKS